MTVDTWLCPICSLLRVKYGMNCPRFPTCPNQESAHLTGRNYLKDLKTDGADATGIGAISDEGKEDSE